MGIMKTTLDLPDELVREVKLRAVMQGRTIKDLVAELLRAGLGIDAKPTPEQRVLNVHIEIDADGFPAFRCLPSAPARSMSVDELLKLEQNAIHQEDLARAGISG